MGIFIVPLIEYANAFSHFGAAPVSRQRRTSSGSSFFGPPEGIADLLKSSLEASGSVKFYLQQSWLQNCKNPKPWEVIMGARTPYPNRTRAHTSFSKMPDIKINIP